MRSATSRWHSPAGVHVVNYNGVACTLRNAPSFQYGGVRSFYFVTRGAPVGGVKKFINWVTHSNKANKIVAAGLDSAALMKRRFGLQKAGPRNRSDQRAELLLGALACVVLALIAGMIIFVFQKAWPSFSHNGLAWFSPWAGGNVDDAAHGDLRIARRPEHYVYTMHAWPLIYATALITIGAVVIGTAFALLSAMFIVEFAPECGSAGVLEPVVRLLAAVPSVIYGLIGILVIVPFVGNHVISQGAKNSVAGVVQLNGFSSGSGS